MRRLIVCFVLVAAVACGGSNDSGSTGPNNRPLTATGTWAGLTGVQGLSLTLLESAGAVTGTGSINGTASGVRALTVSGTDLSGSLALTMSSGTLQPFLLQGTMTATIIRGTLTGSGFTGDSVLLARTSSSVGNAAVP